MYDQPFDWLIIHGESYIDTHEIHKQLFFVYKLNKHTQTHFNSSRTSPVQKILISLVCSEALEENVLMQTKWAINLLLITLKGHMASFCWLSLGSMPKSMIVNENRKNCNYNNIFSREAK